MLQRTTELPRVPNQTILALDSLAAKYDDLFIGPRMGVQRTLLWHALLDRFQAGNRILVVNCGTGEVALFLARFDVSVFACDASELMIQTARKHAEYDTPDTPIQFELLPAKHLSELRSDAPFDGALLNFSGLHGVANLRRCARDLASLITGCAPILVCLSTRFCLAETLWFLLRGNARKAFRRCSGIATVQLRDLAVKLHYPTLRQVTKSLRPSFRMCGFTGLGVAVPPSYLEPVFRKYPRMLRLLCVIDKRICRLPLLRTIGDHMLLRFERSRD